MDEFKPNHYRMEIQLADIPNEEFDKFFKVVGGKHCRPTKDCLAMVMKSIHRIKVATFNKYHNTHIPEEFPYDKDNDPHGEDNAKIVNRIVAPFDFYAKRLTERPLEYRKEAVFDKALGRTKEVRTLGDYWDWFRDEDSVVWYTGAISNCFPDRVVTVCDMKFHPASPGYVLKPNHTMVGYKVKNGYCIEGWPWEK